MHHQQPQHLPFCHFFHVSLLIIAALRLLFTNKQNQAANPRQNYLAVLRLADLGQGRHGKKHKEGGDDDDDESDDESSEDDESSSGV